MKTCAKCGETKSLEEFHRNRAKRDGRASRCRVCANLRVRDQGYHRGYFLQTRYGLTVEQFDAMAEAQSHCCLICQQNRGLVVDHCHTNGHVRGLLCNRCNGMLGDAEANPAMLQRAMDYVRGGDLI